MASTVAGLERGGSIDGLAWSARRLNARAVSAAPTPPPSTAAMKTEGTRACRRLGAEVSRRAVADGCVTLSVVAPLV